jgi:hypothetical protein
MAPFDPRNCCGAWTDLEPLAHLLGFMNVRDLSIGIPQGNQLKWPSRTLCFTHPIRIPNELRPRASVRRIYHERAVSELKRDEPIFFPDP